MVFNRSLTGYDVGQMKAHLGDLLPYSGADFEEAQLDGVEVGLGSVGVLAGRGV